MTLLMIGDVKKNKSVDGNPNGNLSTLFFFLMTLHIRSNVYIVFMIYSEYYLFMTCSTYA